MSLGISFGSIGDLIAVGQIAWALANALSSARGSTKEFQGLITELQTFNNVLLQIVALWQNYESSAELDELGKVAKHAVKEWRDCLWEFRLKFEKKYGASLRPGGSGNWAKDASKKVLWLKEKEDIVELRRRINSANGMISLLVLAAIGKSNKLDEISQKIRIEGVHFKLQESMKLAQDQNAHLKKLHDQMDVQTESSNMILAKVTDGISNLMQVKSTVIDIKGNLEFFRAQMFMVDTTPRGLGTHWKQAPVTLEDAHGNLIPIPLELINSWDMLEVVLGKRFEKLKGHRKVLRKEYAIEDGQSGRALRSQDDWNICFQPGQKRNMAILFKQSQATTSCPGCETESRYTSDSIIQCNKCSMWYQLVEEITSPRQNEPFSQTEFLPSQPDSPINQMKITEIEEDNPKDFKRVRLLYQGRKWDEDLKKLEPIRFYDARGRTFLFPFHLCYSWPGMVQLITESFRFDESLGNRVSSGQYDLAGPDGNMIFPRDWEATVEPGVSITMHLRPTLDANTPELVRDSDPSPIQSAEQEGTELPNKEDNEVTQQVQAERLQLVSDDTSDNNIQTSQNLIGKQEATEIKLKGILRTPLEKFPKDPLPVRESVASLRDARSVGIPPGARWTKISRRMVNPEALDLGKERYEAREDFVIVLRVLTREEIQGYAIATTAIRAARDKADRREARRMRRIALERGRKRVVVVENLEDLER